MSPSHYIAVLLAALQCLHCNGAEVRAFRPQSRPDDLLNNPSSNILDLILKNRGTSVAQIHDRLVSAGNNLEAIVAGLNSEIKGELATIDGTLININPNQAQALLKEGIQALIREKYGNNPAAASILEDNVNRQLSSDKIAALVKHNPIPIESARSFLDSHLRQRRSLQSRDMISDLVLGLVRDQFSSIVWELLENVKNVLIDLRTNIAPTDSLNNVLSYAVNTIVNGGIQLITEIQESIRPTVTTPSPVRRRRQADEGATSSPVDNGGGGGAAVGGGGGGGLTDVLRPILCLLGILLSPVTLLVQGLGNGLLSLLEPILGGLLADGVGTLVNSLLALLPNPSQCSF